MRSSFFTFAMMFIVVVAGHPQSRVKKPTAKKPIIRATVTIKGDGAFKPIKLPNETDPDIWNKFDILDHCAKIEFPSREPTRLERKDYED